MVSAALPVGLWGRARAYVELTKPRIIELLLITTVPAMVVAYQGWPSSWLVVATVVGGTLAAGGANAINMVIDRDIDKVMSRTQGRPLARGALEPRAALVFAITLEIVAFALLWATSNLLAAALALSATLFYVFVYSLWLKRTTRHNIVIGGAAGSVPALVGWAAVTGSLGWAPWLMFALVFLWTPPHFWALAIRYRDDYAAVDVPMLPVVSELDATARQMVIYTAAVWVTALILWPVAHLGWIYGSVAVVSGAFFLGGALDVRRNPTPQRAMKLFGASITYLTAVFVAMAVDRLVFG